MNLKILLIACLAGISVQAVAQDSLYKTRIEAGIGFPVFHVFSHFDLNVVSFSMKFRHGKDAIRSGVNFTTNPDWYTFNLGYERILFGEKLKYFAGIDAGYSKMPMYDEKIQTSYGIGPVMGLWYKYREKYFFQTEYGFFHGPRKIEGRVPLEPMSPMYTTQHRSLSLHVGYIF
jgi:hypothetical protein